LSIALDTVSMLIDSAAHLWQRLEQYAPLSARPQRSALDLWLASIPAAESAPDALQVQRDYRRLCSLLDELEALSIPGPTARDAIRARIAQQHAAAS
jgi:hypothetical protein